MKVTAFLAASVLALAATPALAENGRAIVRYGDLDLTSVQGQQALAERVHDAVVDVCFESAPARDAQECRARTTDQLMARMPTQARDAIIAAERSTQREDYAQR